MTTLLPQTTITAAVAAGTLGPNTLILNAQPRTLTIQANFVYGSGGTTADVYVQTTLDGGVTWTDIANFHFTTSSARKIVNLTARTPGSNADHADRRLDDREYRPGRRSRPEIPGQIPIDRHLCRGHDHRNRCRQRSVAGAPVI